MKSIESKVVITIDTEVRTRNRDLPDPYLQDVLGHLSGGDRGTFWITEELEKHGFAGVFFLDVYGSVKYGADRYRALCDRLLAGGHSIQLHTHPDQMYEATQRHMHEYSLVQQTGIIRDGMDLLKDWTGTSPTSHRAGRYGANEDTLRALHANGIYLDSSFFYGRGDCKLPFANTNAPFQSHGIWEIPVTVAAEPLEKLGYRFPFWTRHFWRHYQKLDVNCMPDWQLCRSVSEASGKVPYIITFLHSFSFTRREPGGGFVPDLPAIASFQALLEYLAQKGMPVVTFEQVAAELAAQTQQPLGGKTS